VVLCGRRRAGELTCRNGWGAAKKANRLKRFAPTEGG
jgi:hypothetical protein